MTAPDQRSDSSGLDADRQLYFAYGSNMNPGQMANRCPDAAPAGVAILESWTFAINSRGVATMVSAEPDGVVEGVLWSVTARCLRSLDRYEGVASGAYVRDTLAVRHDTALVSAIVYLATSNDRGTPRRGYLEGIVEGARHFGLSAPYVSTLEALAAPRVD